MVNNRVRTSKQNNCLLSTTL